MRQRAKFGSRFAAIMAMAGSAVGLGNIWRFPYIVGEYGGAAFILVYIVSTIILSLPVFLSELLAEAVLPLSSPFSMIIARFAIGCPTLRYL